MSKTHSESVPPSPSQAPSPLIQATVLLVSWLDFQPPIFLALPNNFLCFSAKMIFKNSHWVLSVVFLQPFSSFLQPFSSFPLISWWSTRVSEPIWPALFLAPFSSSLFDLPSVSWTPQAHFYLRSCSLNIPSAWDILLPKSVWDLFLFAIQVQFIFSFLATPSHMQDLRSPTRDLTYTPCIRSLNQRTTRKVPRFRLNISLCVFSSPYGLK